MFVNANPEDKASPIKLSTLLASLWLHLTKYRHRQLVLLLGLMLVSAFCEMISLGAVLPFIGVLTAPNKVFDHELFKRLIQAIGITSPSQLVLPVTVGFAIAALVAGSVRVLVLWVGSRVANAVGSDISIEVYRRTLYQPYLIHVSRNSSEMINVIAYKTWGAVVVLQALLTLVSSAFVFVALTIALVVVDPIMVLASALVFGLSYLFITMITRRELQANSEIMAKGSNQVVKALQEGLSAIRDVLLNGTQPIYCEIYREADKRLRRSYASSFFIRGSPRFAVETIGMLMIAGLAYAMSRQDEGVATALPVLGALALGTTRLLPALQQIYASWAFMAGDQASLEEVIGLLNQPMPADTFDPTIPAFRFKDKISFESVRFRYSKNGPWVLDGLNFTIVKGTRVGFVGSTGSGKTTTLDLLMGLLEPTEGRILVDGLPLNGPYLSSWQRTLAHVPQSIFLADTTLAENIAFGLLRKTINMDRVRQATKQAQIAEFIEAQPDGYDTVIGERGIRLSGGERQRIGIARALYKEASVLIFDEATSALDNIIEQAVIDSIEKLNRNLTILIIAHRLTTVQGCHKIIELGHGKVVAEGSFEELIEQSPSFRKMAGNAKDHRVSK